MIPTELDFQRLKSCVSIEMVLAAKGLRGALTRRGDRLIGPCPLHQGDNPTAFVVTLSKDLWHCFTRCDAGGDIVSLVQRLDRTSFTQTATYLAALAGLHDQKPPSRPDPELSSLFRPFPHTLPLLHKYPLLADKGIREATARTFETGAFFGAGFLDTSIAIRLHDLIGRPLGYAARYFGFTDLSRGLKWRFPTRFPKAELLYNWHRTQPHHRPYIVVTECPWGVMRLHQLGVPAVALLGTHLSQTQRQLLTLIPRVILLLDGDQAGRMASARIWEALKDVTDVRSATLPTDLDPDDLADVHLAALLKPFLL